MAELNINKAEFIKSSGGTLGLYPRCASQYRFFRQVKCRQILGHKQAFE